MESRVRVEGVTALGAAGFDALPLPVLVVGLTPGRPLLHANPEAVRALGLDPDRIGADATEVLPAELEPYLERVEREQTAVSGETLLLERDAHAAPVRWALTAAPVPRGAERGTTAAVVSLEDVTGDPLTRVGERNALSSLARTLARERDVVPDEVVAGAARVTGAGCAALYRAGEGRTLELAAETPGAGAPARFELPAATSALWEVLGGRTGRHWTPDDPIEGFALAGLAGWRSGLAAGLGAPGPDLGLLAVGEPAPGGYLDGALEHLEIAAILTGTALTNVRLRTEQREVERLLAGAVETSAQLVGASDPGQVHQRLLDGLVHDMGLAGAALWQPIVHTEEGKASKDGEEAFVLTRSVGLPETVLARLQTVPDVAVPEQLTETVEPRELADAVVWLRSSDWPGHTVSLVPLPAPATGVLGVYARRALPPLMSGVLATLAQAVAAAEHEAALHHQARTVVDALQRELRPAPAELPAGAEAGWVYRSATRGADVGGDFYDLVTMTSGHIGIACGDVSGKGIEAASLTAMAVHTLRAFALQGAEPRHVLSMLNEAVHKQTPAERFLTLAYARIDPSTWTADFTVAGHPSPLVVGADGVRVLDCPPDLPIGVAPDAVYEQGRVRLEPGEALVLLTDGVTEARRQGQPDDLLGIDGVVADLEANPGGTAQDLADRIWGRVQDWTDGVTADDCAIIVLRRGG